MKYVLTFGISFKKFRKPLDIKITSKYLIDHLVIDKDIESIDPWPWNPDHKNVYLKYKIFDQITGKHPLNQIPQKMFFYEIDERCLSDKLVIDIDCEDTNYTNGFMTKAAICQPRMISIIPKWFIEKYFVSKRHNKRFLKKIEMISRYPRPENFGKTGTWPYNRLNWQFKCLLTGKKLNTSPGLSPPSPSEVNGMKRKEYWYGNRKQMIPSTYNIESVPTWIGGKFQISIKIIKKYGIKMLDPWSYNSKKIGNLRTNFFQYERYFKKYYDINIQNEDK